MRVLVAPDKFKGTLSADDAARAIEAGVRAQVPGVHVTRIPVADGGEGTVDAVVAAGGRLQRTTVHGPLGRPTDAAWALSGTTAVLEMAQSSGLALVEPSPTTALESTTFGLGELILAAVDAGASRIVIGVGGSATTDGGMGALRALGVEFTDAAGAPIAGRGADLGRVSGLSLRGLDPRVADIDLVICADVANPFAGPDGAGLMFAAQKGADDAARRALDAGLRSFARVLARETGVDLVAAGWGGAGGGIAGGLHAALGATPADGVDEVARIVDLDARIAEHDLVIVGEGSLDAQSLLGKAPIGVARRAGALGVPAAAVVGRNGLPVDALPEHNLIAIVAASEVARVDAGVAGLALEEPARWVARAAQVAIRAAHAADQR